jgi:hypothetical protein
MMARPLGYRCYGCKHFKYDIFGWGDCLKYGKRISNWISCEYCNKLNGYEEFDLVAYIKIEKEEELQE